MNKSDKINQLVEQAMNSADNAERAVPKPFLLTRINARLNEFAPAMNLWEKAGRFVSMPKIAIPALAMLITVNIIGIVFNKAEPVAASSEQSAMDMADEFDYTAASTSIYDIETSDSQ